MKRLLLSLSAVLVSLSMLTVPLGAEAKRLGGGGSMGMRRSVPPPRAPAPTPTPSPTAPAAAPHAPAAAAAPAAAPAPKRSWMGPLAGLAAGLGLGALLGHMGLGGGGLGGGFGGILMMILMAGAAFMAIRFLMRRFASSSGSPQGLQFAGQGAATRADPSWQAAPQGGGWNNAAAPVAATAAAPVDTAASVPLPAGFDAVGFERVAKMMFIRLQAANDAGDLNDLRTFTTPEMFAAIRLELQERSGPSQQTDVVKLDAELLDTAQDGAQQIVSMRFHGLVREEAQGTAQPFDEVWHMVRPLDGSREWAIAGIAPAVTA